MKAHISDKDIRAYLSRELDPDELFAADEHLEKCVQCFAALSEVRRTEASLPDGFFIDADPDHREHLGYDQFAAYADGDLNEVDKEIADTHLDDCDECSTQLAVFFTLRDELAAGTDPVSNLESKSDSETATGFWNALGWLKIGIPAFAAVLLAVVIWALMLRSPTTQVDNAASTHRPADAYNDSNRDPNVNAPDVIAGVNENGNVNVPVSTAAPVESLVDSGATIAMDASGNLSGLSDSRFDARVRTALTRRSIEISPAVRDLRLKGGVLMGDDQPGVAFTLNGPVGKVVASTRPQFSWRPLKGADSYVVKVFDENFKSVTASPPLRSSSWVPPTPLPHGKLYQWQVTAMKDGEEVVSPVRPAPDARFKVVDASAANDIAAAKRSNSHLVLGITYANAGLIDEAEREFQALAKQNPNSPVVRKLLQNVRSVR